MAQGSRGGDIIFKRSAVCALFAFSMACPSTGATATVSSSAAGAFVVAKVDCGASTRSSQKDAINTAITNALEAPDAVSHAHWDQIQLADELQYIAGDPDPQRRARCYALVVGQSPAMAYELVVAGETESAWTMGRTVAKIWHRYRNNSSLLDDLTAKRAYDDFPDAITRALHYRCAPVAPTDDCLSAWPNVPTSVRSAVMERLLSS